MTWLTRILQALASLAGIDVAGAALAGKLREEIEALKVLLREGEAARERLAATIREVQRERDEWREKALSKLPPGDALGAGLDAARSVLSRARDAAPAVAGVPDELPAGGPARRRGG